MGVCWAESCVNDLDLTHKPEQLWSIGSNFLGIDWWQLAENGVGPRERSVLAYDIRHDVERWRQLAINHGKGIAREILSEEIEEDLAAHFNEVGGEETRVKYFEYKYILDPESNLREAVGNNDLVVDIFAHQESEVVGNMWINQIIPFLEKAEVGQAVFTLSAKNNEAGLAGHEGAYDFGYFFIKANSSEVLAYAMEMDLTAKEQRELINLQLDGLGKWASKLGEFDDWRKVRGTALFYEAGRFNDFESMFGEIVAKPLSNMRGEYELMSLNDFQDFIEYQKEEAFVRKLLASELSRELVGMIERGMANEKIQAWLGSYQAGFLQFKDPETYNQGIKDGYVMLACGMIVMDESVANEIFRGGFDCPNCNGFISWGSGDTCPHCGYTKQENAVITGAICA